MADKAERKARTQRAPEAAKAGKGEKAAKGKPDAARERAVPQVPRVPARLRERYRTAIVPSLMAQFSYTNRMRVPEVKKVVINMGLGEAVGNVKVIDAAVAELAAITGQKPVVTRARKSEAAFKLRAGMAIGCKVTLRGERMYEFLDRLLSVALPRIRDFRGIPTKSFDGRGNYALGIREQLIFPEIRYDKVEMTRGMDICVETSARNDEEARALLEQLGFPFRK
ncbi:MAG: 50S ribosomal protein L5 [candidate division NC10 bacterium]|nr:50S ribosomal protein L5 [candidate division NC10 bacterium]MBI2115334.1 50S ribosomal protein L5 [candidate division NC10 bacterium]MBI2162574.1 50S ribosomal protein L5 [candidate division NC10 bacterium]MBI3085979.1 50S ribosomal protein L5 [candidate division NC10 bacterium]